MLTRRLLLTTLVLALLLVIPSPDPAIPPAPGGGGPFRWDRDSLWSALELAFRWARGAGCDSAADAGQAEVDRVGGLISSLTGTGAAPVPPEAPVLDSLESAWFRLSVRMAACPADLGVYADLSERLREAVKDQSRAWDMAERTVRERLYRALYGGRAALEEVMLQHPGHFPALREATAVPAATPSTVVHGVRIHSGDILVSRGGYPTSALIARGSDYPGNFSHVALVHVDSGGRASTIEAHIESGVKIATAEEYLRDKKLRILVLRPRPDLAALVADPFLPHRAAALALERARAGHIPYDFAMDYTDPTRLFCSEVASAAYGALGVTLWMGRSTITSPGLRRWLSWFGVRHFETQEPSDLEYDPQLAVVAEWRDPAALGQDHIDNAVIDAMLEGAERGDRLTYRWYQLPAARVLKAWSWAAQRLGGRGPIPEGMSPSAALRNAAFSKRQRALAALVLTRADSLAAAQGYPPPYWTLVDLARAAAVERP